MKELFDTSKLEKRPVDHPGTGQTCGKCQNSVRPHYYRKDWIYCKETACKRTQFGIKKVRSRQPACEKIKKT